jgi:large subunit ribosomal protein L6
VESFCLRFGKGIKEMSRIGNQTITVPDKVKVSVADNHVSVEGPKGRLEMDIPKRTSVSHEDNVLKVSRDGDDREARAMHGLSRSLLNNMVQGVSEGFVKKLEINGVGFKAIVSGNKVTMSLGYSHPINYQLPDQVKVTVEKDVNVTIEGPDKQKVGMVAAELRGFYPVEPYKAKGVKYEGEYVRRKEGKTVQ